MSAAANSSDTACAVALAELPFMGPGRLRALLARRTPAGAWRAVANGTAVRDPRVSAVCGSEVDKIGAAWVRAAARIDPARSLERAERAGMKVHLLGEVGYPPELAADPEAPAVCFLLGDAHALAGAARVAVIGTRAATAAGLEMAKRLGHDLADAGVGVVSGLARGIDGAVHAGALAACGAPPIGVVGSGLDVPYPRSNAALWSAVASAGVLVSEAPPGGSPHAWRFPARNRLIAGLADLVVVVESRSGGGSMLTVREAIARGRQVMAVPGSVASAASDGTNQLIYDGCCPVRDALDVLIALGLSAAERATAGRDRGRRRPRGDDGRVLELFESGDLLDVELIARASGLSLSEAALALGRLEDARWITRNGAWWQRA